MINSTYTLNQFFNYNEKVLSEGQLNNIESDKTISSLKVKMSEELKGVKWSLVFDEILNKVTDLLDIDLYDILKSAWKKYKIIDKYLDKENYSPGETFLVPLVEHTIKSEHHPYIEIFVNENKLGKVTFQLLLSLKINGVILKIQDGEIKEIQEGNCKGEGVVKYKDIVLLEKKLDIINLT